MAKSGQEIIREQLGELTFQLCMMDAERAALREENAKLKEENRMLREGNIGKVPVRPESGHVKEASNGN